MGRDRDFNREQPSAGAPHPEKMRAEHDIIGLIIDRQPTFSKANRRIAQAILSEPHRFVERSIEELTAWLQVSAPTVTRFARTVGCDGLKDLKLKIMGSIRVGINYLEPATPPSSTAEVADRVAKRAQKAISHIHQDLDIAQADKVIELISRCQTLYAFGSGGVSSWLTEEIQNRFFRLGIRVIACNDHQMQFMLASAVDPKDAVICFSLSGNNPELARAVAVAREYGAATIALAASNTPLALAVETLMPVDAQPDDDILSPSSMRYAFMIVIDLLAYGVAIRKGEMGREKLRRLKQQFANLRGNADVQPLCD